MGGWFGGSGVGLGEGAVSVPGVCGRFPLTPCWPLEKEDAQEYLLRFVCLCLFLLVSLALSVSASLSLSLRLTMSLSLSLDMSPSASLSFSLSLFHLLVKMMKCYCPSV